MTEHGYDVIMGDKGLPIKMWTRGVSVEPEARQQLERVAQMPFVFKHVAIMPDVHWGIGATVGSVIATKGAIIPAAVGVDIGCGMVALRTGLRAEQLPDSLAPLRAAIEERVPVGGPGDVGAWKAEDVPAHVQAVNDLEGPATNLDDT